MTNPLQKSSYLDYMHIKKAEQYSAFSVRIGGLEPPRLAPLDPKSNAATNYAISAKP